MEKGSARVVPVVAQLLPTVDTDVLYVIKCFG